MKRHLTIATAGHIDHGKTALVRALTGMETDRLEEEKRRGITIELGFAFLGDDITIIDVPGHERFIKTMVAGVGAVDLVLLIVAADEGVMPQTREHLDIIQLLGIPALHVIITKVGEHDEAWLRLVADDVRNLLPPAYQNTARTFLCDSISGVGIEPLKQFLMETSLALHERGDSGLFRLPVDRAFALKGFGTVVTGTILGGEVRVGDQLQVMPLGADVRVRGLQSHTRGVKSLGVGQRAALNLIGSDVKHIQRGDWICQAGAFAPTLLFDTHLILRKDAPPLRNRDRVRLHLGTSDVIGRVMLLDCDSIEAGGEGLAQIILEQSCMAVRHDRFIIRRYSPLMTLGGGEILDPLPVRHRRHDAEILRCLHSIRSYNESQALMAKVEAAAGMGMTVEQAGLFVGLPISRIEPLLADLQAKGDLRAFGALDRGLLISRAAYDNAKNLIIRRVEEFHRDQPDQLGIVRARLISELSSSFAVDILDAALVELLVAELVQERELIRIRGHARRWDEETEKLNKRIIALLAAGEFNTLTAKQMAQRLSAEETTVSRSLGALQLGDFLVGLGDGSFLLRQRFLSAWDAIRRELEVGGEKTTSELREALGYPRRTVVALLEYLDKIGWTERQEDHRRLGKRRPEAV